MASKWSKVSRATVLIARWATEAKTAFRNSENRVEKIRAPPSSKENTGVEECQGRVALYPQ